jgi:hypothetical protein
VVPRVRTDRELFRVVTDRAGGANFQSGFGVLQFFFRLRLLEEIDVGFVVVVLQQFGGLVETDVAGVQVSSTYHFPGTFSGSLLLGSAIYFLVWLFNLSYE